jgi:hypothetical protein
MKVLNLTLKKKWFDMIKSGEKKEEYREVKEYWNNRLLSLDWSEEGAYKKFDVIRFTNGYSKAAPYFYIASKGVGIGYGKTKWGADGTAQYIFKLGKIISENEITTAVSAA